MPMPTKRARSCNVPTAAGSGSKFMSMSMSSHRAGEVKKVSLFEQKRLRGFWPCVADDGGQQTLAVSQSTPQIATVLGKAAWRDDCVDSDALAGRHPTDQGLC